MLSQVFKKQTPESTASPLHYRLLKTFINSSLMFPLTWTGITLCTIDLKHAKSCIQLDIHFNIQDCAQKQYQAYLFQMGIQINIDKNTNKVESDYQTYQNNCVLFGLQHLTPKAFEIAIGLIAEDLELNICPIKTLMTECQNTGKWSLAGKQPLIACYDKTYAPAVLSLFTSQDQEQVEELNSKIIKRFANKMGTIPGGWNIESTPKNKLRNTFQLIDGTDFKITIAHEDLEATNFQLL